MGYYDKPMSDEPEFDENLFRPGFSKEYDFHGTKFTVEVQYLGFLYNASFRQQHTWMFAISVKGNRVVTGPFRNGWNRSLTDEAVANNLATFWGPSSQIQEAQREAGTLEYQLNEIVEKCADFMFGYLAPRTKPAEHRDYDIVSKFMSEDEWSVVLRPNYIPNRLVEFYKKADRDHIQIHSYVEEDELFQKPW